MDPKILVPLILQIALILMIASVGLQAHWRDVFTAVKNAHGLLRAVIAVNLVVPLVAVLACMALPIATPIKVGIVIMAVSPLAPLVPGKLIRGGMDASRVAGLYAVLALLSVLIVPATVALLSWLFPAQAHLSIAAIGRLVATSVLVPLAAGIFIGSVAPTLAKRIAKPVGIAAYVALGVIGLALLVMEAGQILALVGNGAVFAMAAAAGAGIVAGHLLGGPDSLARKSLAIAASTRHPGIAALIAKANFDGDRHVLLAIVLFLLVSGVASAIYQQWLKARSPDQGVPARA